MRRVSILLLLLLAAACNSPAGLAGDRFVLVSINNSALPLAYPGFPAIEVTGGEVVLRTDDTLDETLEVRCTNPRPPGTTCQVPPGGLLQRRGTYSRSGGWVRLANVEYATSFTNNSVIITFGSVSQGLPPAVHEYRR